MKANWIVLALAVLLLIACLSGGPNRRCYDCTSIPTFDPIRPVRIILLRPVLEATKALAAAEGW